MRKHKSDTYGGWLKTEIEVFVSYHNHKETMAWTATALFLAAAVAFLSAIPRIATEHQYTATVVIVLASLAIAGFVIMQFCMRWSAANTCDGLRAALTKVYGGGYLNVAVSTNDDRVPGLPRFVSEEIASAAQRKRRWRRDFYRDPRWQSELASYFLLVLACVGCSWQFGIRRPRRRAKSKRSEGNSRQSRRRSRPFHVN